MRPPITTAATFVVSLLAVCPALIWRQRSGPRKPLPHRKVFERNPGPASLTNYCSET
jgi:hypothetical protein